METASAFPPKTAIDSAFERVFVKEEVKEASLGCVFESTTRHVDPA